MPYPKRSLSRQSVGIEINRVVYFSSYFCDIRQDELAVCANTIKYDIARKFEAVNQLKLRLPTRDEAKILVEKTKDDWSLNYLVCNKPCDVWITPNPDHPKKTFATVSEFSARPHQPSENTRAALYLVAKPDDEQIFYGGVDEYGTPTPETSDVYKKLLESPLPLKL